MRKEERHENKKEKENKKEGETRRGDLVLGEKSRRKWWEVRSKERRSKRCDPKGREQSRQQLLWWGADGARRSGYGRRAWSPSTRLGRPEQLRIHKKTLHPFYSFTMAQLRLSLFISPSSILSVLTHACCWIMQQRASTVCLFSLLAPAIQLSLSVGLCFSVRSPDAALWHLALARVRP